MSKKMDAALRKVSELVDELSAPNLMTLEEAYGSYESVQADLDARPDGLRCDMKNREG